MAARSHTSMSINNNLLAKLPVWQGFSGRNRLNSRSTPRPPRERLRSYGLTGMYGPPVCRKRKTKVTGWSAQMYPAFVEHKLLALDGMRCALVLLS